MSDPYVITPSVPTTDTITTATTVQPTGQLPATGGDPTGLAIAALILVIAGLLALALAGLKRSLK